jgi:hypothetical protein
MQRPELAGGTTMIDAAHHVAVLTLEDGSTTGATSDTDSTGREPT